MSMVTTIRMPEDQYAQVRELAAFEGQNVSTFMRNAILDKVTNMQDYDLGISVLKEKNNRISRDEVAGKVFIEQ